VRALKVAGVVRRVYDDFNHLGQPDLSTFNPEAYIHNFLFKLNLFVSSLVEDKLDLKPNTLFDVKETSISMYYRINKDNRDNPRHLYSSQIFDDESLAEFVFVNGWTSVSLLIGEHEMMEHVINIDIGKKEVAAAQCCLIM
jgi:hypothetical protein